MSQDERLLELGRFLRDRRGRIRPTDAGLPAGTRRRVPGLRREEVASLAGIGVSWYTQLENGEAAGVSEATLVAVADALRLSSSEREYLRELIERSEALEPSAMPGRLVRETLRALVYPSYVINARWDIVGYNEPFARAWALAADEAPFNAIERLFLDPVARRMHGTHFADNITPVIAMLRSTHGRRSYWDALSRLRDRLLTEDAIRRIWESYEIASPVASNACTIESPLGTFRYETLVLPVPGADHGITVQIPDAECRALFAADARTT